jgi:predicted nicotinamide N-methyase
MPKAGTGLTADGAGKRGLAGRNAARSGAGLRDERLPPLKRGAPEVTMAPSRSVALEIAGFPVTDLAFRHGEVSLQLYAVARLESFVDRESLLREEETPDPPYWAHLWVGARALARQLAGEPLAARRVLDLGCGLGLPGLVAAARGAEVWLADREPAALEFVRASATRNGLGRVHPVVVDFTRDSLEGAFDVILGAEIVYEPAAYEPLAAFVDAHLAPDGMFLVTDAFRSDAARFFENLTARGLRGDRRALREWEDGRWQGVFLWSFRR